MEYPASTRDDLARGETYPVGRDVVVAALQAANVEHLSLLYFLRGGQRWDYKSGGVLAVSPSRRPMASPPGIEAGRWAILHPLWHVDGTTSHRTPSDQGLHAYPQDMNKIMMAVLQALQDEQERQAEKAADQGLHPA